MIDYDSWLLSWPGGPEDPAQYEADALQEMEDRRIMREQDRYRRLNPRERARARRMAKRSTARRLSRDMR